METSPETPRWVFNLGCLLVAVGGMAGSLGLFAPTMFFSDFPSFSQWEEISFVTTAWGIRNFGMALAMVLALWLESPGAIGVVFSMRFLTETGDLLSTLCTGHGSFDTPPFVLAAIWIALFLVPEALAAQWGLTAACTELKNKKK
eukprot:g11622.t1